MNFKIRPIEDFSTFELSCMSIYQVTSGEEVYDYAKCKFLTNQGYKWVKFPNQHTHLEAGKSYLVKGIIVPEIKNGFENLTLRQVSTVKEIGTVNKPVMEEIIPVSK